MKVFKQANLVRIVILAAMAVLICPNAILAKPGLENPSFETGDLSGWTTDIPDSDYLWGGSIDVVEKFKSYEKIDGVYIDFYVYPKDGTGKYFAVLKPTYYTGFYTTLSQTFDASAGDKISGWAFFDARDIPLCNDDAYVRIIDPYGEVVTVFEASVSTVVPYGWTEWTEWEEYTCTEEGTYTIEARVANNGMWGLDSYLGLDSDVLTVQKPKVLKQDIINKLEDYAYESKRIRKAIREIEKSLEDKLWADDFHLKSKGGKKVLDRERHAARELVHLLKGIPDSGKCGGISLIELEYTDSLPINVEVYLKNVLLGSFPVEEGDTFVVEATDATGGKLHPEIKLVSNGIELTKIHTSCSKPINIDDEHGDFIIVHLEKLPPKNGKKGKKHQISEEAQVAVETAIEQLVEVDRMLAEIQLNDALLLDPDDPTRKDKFEREKAKAEKELAKGDEDRDDYNFGKAIHHLGKAIQHYKKAWEHATHAIKEATKLPKS